MTTPGEHAAGPPPTEAAVRDALRVVMDPDLGRDVVDAGFIHDVSIDGDAVLFELRLTTPACPVRDDLERQCREAVAALPGVASVAIRVTASTRASAAVAGAAALRGVRHVVLVGSGKGGVGKSTATVQLARALAAAGARVAVLDADIHGPSLVAMTGADVPTEEGPDGTVPPEVDGIAVVSMGMFLTANRPTLLRGPRVTGLVRQLLTAFAWGERDYLLVDCPPGTGDVHLTLAQLAPVSGAVLVTTPQEVALADTRRAATMFRTLDVPIAGVVETMAGFLCPSCDTLHPIFGEGGGARLATDLGVPLLGRIPLDPAIVASGEQGVALPADAPAAAAWREAGGALARRLSVLADQRGDALDQFELVWRDVG